MEKILENLIIEDIVICTEVYSEKDARRNITNRNSFGFVFSTYGKITYYQKDNKFTTSTNSFILIPKDATYHLICDKKDTSYVINFNCNLILNDIMEFNLNDPKIIEIAKNIIDIYHKKSLGWKPNIIGLIYQIITLQLKNSDSPKFPKHIENSIQFIQKNFQNEKITNNDIALYANISTVYLQKEFIKYLKVSPHKFLIDYRINEAKRLLISTFLNISEIAYKVGFSSIYDFSRRFKKTTSTSPQNFRKINSTII